jgi:phosphatidylglycerophosphate synthase
VLGVAAGDAGDLRAACAALRALDADLDEVAGGYGAVGLVLLALVRAGVTVGAYNVRFLHCARVGSAPEAEAAVAALGSVDEERGALREAVKEDDDFVAAHLVSSYTPWIVRFFARHGVSSNAVTWLSVLIAMAAAAGFATGTRAGLVAGAVGFYLSFVLDCCDGQLARFTGRYSRYGGWLDMMADRFKEYAALAALAVGGVRTHQHGVWALALAAVCLQTVRHVIDTWYGALQHTATRSLPVVPLDQPLDTLGLRAARRAAARAGAPARRHAAAPVVAVGAVASTAPTGAHGGTGGQAAVDVEPGGGFGATLGRIAATADGRYRSPGYWIKRSVVLPIADRWLLIALTAALFGPRTAFIVLLVAAGLAFGYVIAGRTLRALSMRIAVMPRYDIPVQRDDGVLARAIGRAAGRRFPPVPMALPALLAGLAALAAAVTGHPPPTWVVPATAALALLAALASAAPHDGPLDWLTVAALRAMEYAFILTVLAAGHVPLPLGYALLGTLVLYHYDLLGRMEKQATPMAGTWLIRGWELRVVLLAALATAGLATAGVIAVLVAVGGVVVIGPVVGLLRRAPA